MDPFSERPDPVTERHVQAIWYDATLRPSVLRTSLGTLVTVVDPGVWNTGPGPDFIGATLVYGEGWLRKGDVEVHLRPADWTAHGHGTDPAYAGVIAHVTWFGGPAPSTLPAACVSVCLGDFMRTRLDFAPDEIDVKAYPYARLPNEARPCSRYLPSDPDAARQVLRAAGRRRLRGKARRLAMRPGFAGNPEQVFYEEMLAACGYAGNAEIFRRAGEALPLADLPRGAEQAGEALYCAAMLSGGGACARHGRPANDPKRRLADAAALFTGGKPTGLGAHRAAAILANVIVPFALARGALDEPPERLPPEDVSSPMRLTAFRLFGRDHNPALYAGNGVYLQGLLQIHREFCLAAHPECLDCALNERLEQLYGDRT